MAPVLASAIKRPSTALLLVAGGMLPLAIALVGQYGFGLFPCDFCLLQRYPYLLAIATGLALRVVRGPRARALLVTIGILAFLSTAGIGAYHTGVERGWVDYTGGCVADASANGSIDELRAQILGAPNVSCADATAMFAGLSMASWNVLFALGMAALTFIRYRMERPHE